MTMALGDVISGIWGQYSSARTLSGLATSAAEKAKTAHAAVNIIVIHLFFVRFLMFIP
jgi:hypothetical protein